VRKRGTKTGGHTSVTQQFEDLFKTKMKFPTVTPDVCAAIAREIFSKETGYSNKTTKALDKEICESLIGTSYDVCSEVWNLINPSETEELEGAHPKHLLWALLFLKCYCTMPILTRVVGGVDEKTFRKWTWVFVAAVAGLKPRVVSFLVDCCSCSFSFSHCHCWPDCLEEPLERLGWCCSLLDFG
jgi:hypothetical protein